MGLTSKKHRISTDQLLRAVAALVSGRSRPLRAVEILETHKLPGVCGLIARLAQSPDAEVRVRAMQLLGTRRCRDWLDVIVRGLGDRDYLVRTAAAESLKAVRSPRAVAPLSRCLADRSHYVRSAAAITLSAYNDPRAKRAVVGRFNHERNKAVRLRLAAALYIFGQPRNPAMVAEFLTSEDYRTRCAAANILSWITKPTHKSFVVAKLRQALRKETSPAARSSLGNAMERFRSSKRKWGRTRTLPQ